MSGKESIPGIPVQFAKMGCNGKPSEEIIQLGRFMKHQKNWRNDTKLAVKVFPDTGRGLISRRAIEKDSEIIDLPFDALISLKSISDDGEFMQLLEEVSGEMKWKVQTLLTLYLLWNWHLGEKSPWKDYLRSLPTTLTHPHFCSVDELVAIPVISERIIDSVNQSEVREVQKYFEHTPCPCCGGKFFPDIFPKRKFIEFYLICNSRTVYVPPDTVRMMLRGTRVLGMISNDPNMALAPFLDLFNHSGDTKTMCSLARKGTTYFYTLKTSSSFRRGEQIFINYGPHCNMKLLIEYGFFLPGNCNEFIEVSMKDIEDLVKNLRRSQKNLHIPSNKFRYIRDHNLHEKMFLDADGFSHNLSIVLHFLLIDGNIYENHYHPVVFGQLPDEQSLREYKKHLINLLLERYRDSLVNLQHVERLTESGMIVRDFLKCRIAFMSDCLNKY